MLLCFDKKLYNSQIFSSFFFIKVSLKCNGIRFLRNDDRRVVKCWNENHLYNFYKLHNFLKEEIYFPFQFQFIVNSQINLLNYYL